MDIGLRVEYDGKKNVVLAGEIIKEYPIGGLMCEYARLRPLCGRIVVTVP
jgi:hypothetical protein